MVSSEYVLTDVVLRDVSVSVEWNVGVRSTAPVLSVKHDEDPRRQTSLRVMGSSKSSLTNAHVNSWLSTSDDQLGKMAAWG